jgi:hypothetical protein
MRRQSNNLLDRRAKLKKSAYMLAAVFFCIVGVVFAWFNNFAEMKIDTLTLGYSGERWGMTTSYAVSDGTAVQSDDASESSDGAAIQSDDANVSSYDTDILSYYKSLDGEDAYQVISGGDGFAVTVNPGQGIVFRTVLSNADSTDKNISLYLTGTSYSKSLQGAVRIGILQAVSDGTTETTEIEVTDNLVSEKTEGDDTICYLESVQLAKDITIPAGDGTSPGTATIDWYIWIDGSEVENACQNASLTIGQLQMVTKE